MSNTSSKEQVLVADSDKKPKQGIMWGPVAGIVWCILIYLLPQILAGFVLSLYPLFHHWDQLRTNDWLANAVSAQFTYTLMAEALAVSTVGILLTHYKATWRSLGLLQPSVRDIKYVVGGFGVYFVIYVALVIGASHLVPGFNANQQQSIGFQGVSNGFELFLAFVSLVILPPIAEEIIFRGFLFTGLRRKWDLKTSAVIASLLFAAPHLIEGVSGLLWVGGVDTFVLSMVLCFLRERTGRITPGIGVHALKNCLAFMVIFIFQGH